MWLFPPNHEENTIMPPGTTHSFNIVLSNRTFDALTRLAKERDVTRAHLIRSMIRNLSVMVDRQTPICADGDRCVAPHLHPCSQAQDTTPAA